jgi:2,3-bisphosphoglycerate-independent phosphoglycerate mutase
MSARAVTDRAVEIIAEQDPDVMVLNYANPDMVGHTGDYEATIDAVETVDAELDRLGEAIAAAGGHRLVTADHGNAEDMGTADHPHTAHTSNPVPFIWLAPDGTGGRIRDGGTLADVTPTILSLLGVEKPGAMTGTSLLRSSD